MHEKAGIDSKIMTSSRRIRLQNNHRGDFAYNGKIVLLEMQEQ